MSTIPTPESDRTLTVEFLFDTEAACISSFRYINRWGGLRIGDSIIKVVSASRALPRDKDDIYPDNSAESTPSYPRQQIISEEWTTDCKSPAWIIDADNEISGYAMNWCSHHHKHPIALAPTKEFIDEILLIRQGKWIPLEGDWYCEYCNACEGVHEIANSGVWLHNRTSSRYYKYFPSIKQRDEWISKNRPVEMFDNMPPDVEKLISKQGAINLAQVMRDSDLDYTARHSQVAQDEQTQPSPHSDEFVYNKAAIEAHRAKEAAAEDNYSRGYINGYNKGSDEAYVKAKEEILGHFVKHMSEWVDFVKPQEKING